MTIRHSLRDLGLSIAPSLTLQVLSWRSQRLIMANERKSGRLSASQEFIRQWGSKVLAGPFKGLEYPEKTVAERNLVGKILASYEDELHEFVEEICEKKYSMIINVGSADGYYTVGLALRAPLTKVIAFDTDIWARQATKALALLNGAKNIQIRSMCSPAVLREILPPNGLLVSDCEGYETTLLDPSECPQLKTATILVEIHEHNSPGAESIIRKRFSDSHEIRVATSRRKKSADYKPLSTLSEEMSSLVISEGRGSYIQNWLLLLPMTSNVESE